MSSRLRTIVPAVVLGLLAAACGLGNPAQGETIEVSAEFNDVIDLVTGAHVRAGDVPIGTVTDIALTDAEMARVTMVVEDETGLPGNTVAVLAKTSMLGERFIDLRPPEDEEPVGALEDGQSIVNTTIITDFEDLVTSGSDLLAFMSADRLAAAVETGAIAFGGREDLIGTFLDDVEAFIGRYDESSDDLVAFIDSVDRLTAAYEADADANAQVLEDLRLASQAFQQEDDQLLDTLEDVTRLSEVGQRILERNADELTNLIRRLRKFLDEFTRIDGALQGVLTWLPRHNEHVPNGSIDEHAQVWLDFLVCGVQDTQGDPSRDCVPPNPGQRSVDPGYYPYPEECWDDVDACPQDPEPQDGEG